MAVETLREFLASIGFKVDDASNGFFGGGQQRERRADGFRIALPIRRHASRNRRQLTACRFWSLK